MDKPSCAMMATASSSISRNDVYYVPDYNCFRPIPSTSGTQGQHSSQGHQHLGQGQQRHHSQQQRRQSAPCVDTSQCVTPPNGYNQLSADTSQCVSPPIGYNHLGVASHYDQQQRQSASRVTPASSTCSSTAQGIPQCMPYAGQYGFHVSFDDQPKDAKSMTWTFSRRLNKMYVRLATSCPFRFRTEHPLPDGCVLRAMAVYSKPEHAQDVVQRCPNHVTSREHNDDPRIPAQHVLRCDHAHALYDVDAYSGHNSVVVPYEPTVSQQQPPGGAPVATATSMTLLYQFMCFSSCVGGINRRPLQVLFILECRGLVLGRQCVEVRICACPGRDLRAEESVYDSNDVSNTTKARPIKRPFSQANMQQQQQQSGVGAHASSAVASQRRRLDNGRSGSGDTYTLQVEGRDNYELLVHVRDALECLSRVASSRAAEAAAPAATTASSSNSDVHERTATAMPASTTPAHVIKVKTDDS